MSIERGFLSSEPKTMMMKKMNYPTRKKSSKSQSTTISSPSPSSDLLPIPSCSLKKQPSYLKWVPNHKAAPPPKPTSHSLKPSSDPPGPPPPPLPAPRVNTHLQDKVLTLSADVDSYRSSLLKKTHYQKQELPTTTIKNHHSIAEMERSKKGCKEMKEKVKVPRVKGGEEEKRKSVSLANNGGGGGGGRRKSCGSSEIELGDFFSKVGVRVMAVDMPPFMQIHAVSCAREVHDSLDKFTSKSLALTLKKEFDGVYGPAWHCIVGTSFGSFVTHSVGGFLYFSMDPKLYILLFKTAVQKAD